MLTRVCDVLAGMKQLVREGEPLPELFTDPLVQRASNWVLSTSAVFSKHFGPYGWGEVRMDCVYTINGWLTDYMRRSCPKDSAWHI